MKYFADYKRKGTGYIVASACADFTDGDGDNPPHKKARKRYEAIIDAGNFLCTHEYADTKNPQPIVFTIEAEGLKFVDQREKGGGLKALAAGIEAARGTTQPPTRQIGFGRA
jgi:hypothetical protein